MLLKRFIQWESYFILLRAETGHGGAYHAYNVGMKGREEFWLKSPVDVQGWAGRGRAGRSHHSRSPGNARFRAVMPGLI
jgi:hypothetical protein